MAVLVRCRRCLEPVGYVTGEHPIHAITCPACVDTQSQTKRRVLAALAKKK